MKALSKLFLYVCVLSILVVIVQLVMGKGAESGPAVVVLFSALALYFMGNKVLKGFAFSIWVFAAVASSLYYPGWFGTWYSYDLKGLIVPLIQIIMFGMGTTLSVKDFARVFAMPLPILIGMVLQFGAKPVIGLLTALALGLKGEVAAGVVLIGSVPGGVASNLMTYLASGDVALSVTMTSCSTLVSPVMTPFVMQKLGGRFISIDFLTMMFSILNMIIVPIIAGLLANRILYSRSKWANSARNMTMIVVVSMAVAIVSFFFQNIFVGMLIALRGGIIIGTILLAAVSLAKLIVSLILRGGENWMDKTLPIVSMAGIVFIIAIITARSKEQLVTVGIALIIASFIQIFSGYILGYWISRLCRMDEKTARTVSIEVGLQNGGMASGLAINVLKSAEAALASAVYGPLMNITGSILATYWHRKPVKHAPGKGKAEDQTIEA